MQIKAQLQPTGADDVILASLTQKIDDLHTERLLSGEYERYVRARVSSMTEQQICYSSASRSSDFNPSNDVNIDKANV